MHFGLLLIKLITILYNCNNIKRNVVIVCCEHKIKLSNTPFTLAAFHEFSLRLAIHRRTQGVRGYNAGTSASIRERSAMKRGGTHGSREKLNMFNLSLRLDVYIKKRKQSAVRT